MSAKSRKVLCLQLAAAHILGALLGSGMHLHLLLAHEHEGEGAHGHLVYAHSHADFPEASSSSSYDYPARKHRHHVPLICIVVVQSPTTHAVSLRVDQLEVYLLPGSELSTILTSFSWLAFTDTSPPLRLLLIADLSGRSPPLV